MQLTYIHPPTGNETPKNQAYIEYPKFVHFTDGRKSVIVADAEEEAVVLAGKHVLEKTIEIPSAQPVGATSDEKAALVAIAQQRGIKIDKRWCVEKITAALAGA